jgi:hypothetical protein
VVSLIKKILKFFQSKPTYFHTFYDVKTRKKITCPVTEKVIFGENRYALKGKTQDGRNLTIFVSKETWDRISM